MAHIGGPEVSLSDAHDTLEDYQYVDRPGRIEEIEVPTGLDVDDAVQRVKISASENVKDDNSPMNSSRGASISTSLEQRSDAASVQSLPLPEALAAHSDPLPQRPSTARSVDTPDAQGRPTQPSPPHSPSPQLDEGLTAQQQRRARHRTTFDTRASNRLSGFFTNLIHRRDHQTNGSARSTIREDPTSTTPGQTSEAGSRASSPAPGRPLTPPPPLPAPTLQELGLSLSVLTSDLSPSHFTTPPSSGAFLLPHYLLLCHSQGLDVLPLVSPPTLQPYALVRRINFKSVVVMEQRGVLVAIAGRRDGVRVYALEEVKKAIEWRIDMEARRERERSRREIVKKLASGNLDNSGDSHDSTRKASLSTPPPGDLHSRGHVLRKSSHSSIPTSLTTNSVSSAPLIPRSPTPRRPKKHRTLPMQIPAHMPEPNERPPPYSSPSEFQNLQRQNSVPSFSTRSRSASVSNVLAGPPRNVDTGTDIKNNWTQSSDDEAIDIVAAETSGSQALDERTSATLSANTTTVQSSPIAVPAHTTATRSSTRRNRPSNLDLSLSRSVAIPPPEPSPAPTLMTLRQALSQSPPTVRNIHTATDEPDNPFGTAEEDEEDGDDGISLNQVLLESRIPDLPPLGTRRPQQPILLSSSNPTISAEPEPPSPRTAESHVPLSRPSTNDISQRRRRRWSTLLGSPHSGITEPASSSTPAVPSTAPISRERPTDRFTRSRSFRTSRSHSSTIRPSSSRNESSSITTTITAPPETQEVTTPTLSAQSSRSSRFISRIISNAFHNRRSEERPPLPTANDTDPDGVKKVPVTPVTPHAPPPKLEYVKLPGTKGALMIKAVETAKKSFLAILCGENGEKVELFAGTYRTALGLSRTFILPDSPRSLELQLQGDDLVEVFLVFSQNVFGLEPATVRVREVRIGRAERRAARRRAREARQGENPSNDSEAVDDDINVNVSIGVTVPVGSTAAANGNGDNRPGTPPLIPNEHPDAHQDSFNATNDTTTSAIAEELVAVATAQMGPYTTFQQLSFAPKFPLASIADEYIIPPTYPSFLEYRAEYEPANGNATDLTQVEFTPPGLPLPVPTAPSRWYYRDPKGFVHGPWKASFMQAWYKDGLLPPDLPVRREEDDTYMLLKDLRLQSVDPTHPFQSSSPPVVHTMGTVTPNSSPDKPLLPPISLLAQPRHFGPPALFFSSRGGHSTAVVDARGRSVLKGRFLWSPDEVDEDLKPTSIGRMGDVKRIEALDIDNRAVLVAMRQGGLEAVDLNDALLRPADESRTVLPNFAAPASNINRRAPFIWKIGTPVSSSGATTTIPPSKGKGTPIPYSAKKLSTGPTKSPSNRSEFAPSELESDNYDEVLFLGRKDDEIYICERNLGSFRILRLCPSVSS